MQSSEAGSCALDSSGGSAAADSEVDAGPLDAEAEAEGDPEAGAEAEAAAAPKSRRLKGRNAPNANTRELGGGGASTNGGNA